MRNSLLYSLIFFAFLANQGHADDADQRPVVKLSPKVREQDRGADFYAAIPCRELGRADALTPREKAHLDARKQACLERYQQFAPRSLQR